MKVKITQKYRFFRTVPKPNWNIVKIKKKWPHVLFYEKLEDTNRVNQKPQIKGHPL
jgi:hypothetical protein